MSDFETAFRTWIRVSLQSYINDNPDTEFQRGHLAATLEFGIECGMKHEQVWKDANDILNRSAPV